MVLAFNKFTIQLKKKMCWIVIQDMGFAELRRQSPAQSQKAI